MYSGLGLLMCFGVLLKPINTVTFCKVNNLLYKFWEKDIKLSPKSVFVSCNKLALKIFDKPTEQELSIFWFLQTIL